MESGGELYEYIECLNSDDAHLDMLFGLIESNLQGWAVDPSDSDAFQLRDSLAKAKGSKK